MKYGFPMIVVCVVERIVWKFLYLCDFIRSQVLCWLWGIEGRNVRFQGKAYVRAHHKGDIRIGDNSVFNSRASTNPVGLMNSMFLDTRPGGRIVIGHDCGFSSAVISSRESVSIGSYVKVGGNVRIFDHDFHAMEWENRRSPEKRSAIRSRSVVIEDDVFIGTNAIILKGTHLGARTVVAAGSVVFGLNVPADSLVKGNPAVVVTTLKGEE